MSAIEFHTGVDEPLAYACRLLRKASRQRARVAVRGPAALMEQLDTLLWTFEATSFVAHRRVGAPGPHEVSLDTPIWLMDQDAPTVEVGQAGHGDAVAMKAPDVLLNLGEESVSDPSAWLRIIELVPHEPAARQRARRRWRDYEAHGLTPVHRAVTEATS